MLALNGKSSGGWQRLRDVDCRDKLSISVRPLCALISDVQVNPAFDQKRKFGSLLGTSSIAPPLSVSTTDLVDLQNVELAANYRRIVSFELPLNSGIRIMNLRHRS